MFLDFQALEIQLIFICSYINIGLIRGPRVIRGNLNLNLKNSKFHKRQ